jgi:hypothetical protein
MDSFSCGEEVKGAAYNKFSVAMNEISGYIRKANGHCFQTAEQR